MTRPELTEWLKGVAREVRSTQGEFSRNKEPGCPMPFFGNVLDAPVLTVGVNPSNTEFTEDRGWRPRPNRAQWEQRLLDYFNLADVPPHGWFETWSICLELLGIGYVSGRAAHVDVSPRPTKRMLGKETDKPEFRRMVERDVKWFFELVSGLPQVKLLLVAGPIPQANGRKQQLVEFIRQSCPAHGASWVECDPLPRLEFGGQQVGIPIFACPYEPDQNGLYSMVRQVYRNRDLLREIIE